MVDTLGPPTVFFTHSATDLQWPELANLTCKNSPEDASAHRRVVIDNPAVADWFFLRAIPTIPQVLLSGHPWCKGLLAEV